MSKTLTLLDLHWLVFNDRREITGCHCGFSADNDQDCGWGDGTIRHLMECAWEQGRADFGRTRLNPYAQEPMDSGAS